MSDFEMRPKIRPKWMSKFFRSSRLHRSTTEIMNEMEKKKKKKKKKKIARIEGQRTRMGQGSSARKKDVPSRKKKGTFSLKASALSLMSDSVLAWPFPPLVVKLVMFLFKLSAQFPTHKFKKMVEVVRIPRWEVASMRSRSVSTVRWAELYLSGHCEPPSCDVHNLWCGGFYQGMRIGEADVDNGQDLIFDVSRKQFVFQNANVLLEIRRGDSWRWAVCENVRSGKFDFEGDLSGCEVVCLVGWFESQERILEAKDWVYRCSRCEFRPLVLLVRMESARFRKMHPNPPSLFELLNICREEEAVGIIRVNPDLPETSREYFKVVTEIVLRRENVSDNK